MTLLETKESFINFHANQICSHAVTIDLRPVGGLEMYSVDAVTADGQVYTPPQSYQFNGFAAGVNFVSWLNSIFGDASVVEDVPGSTTIVTIANSPFEVITLNGTYSITGSYDYGLIPSCVPWEADINECQAATDDCLPVIGLSDLSWQTFLVDLSDSEKIAIGAEPNDVEIRFYAKVCTDCDDTDHEVMNWELDANLFEGINVTGPFSDGFSNGFKKVYTGWNAVLNSRLLISTTNFNTLNVGDCFNICLWKTATALNVPYAEPVWSKVGCSGCFFKSDEDCYTSILKVQQNEVSMGFYNDGTANFTSFYNSVRVPIYAHSPQYNTVKKVYRKSDGTQKKLAALMTEVYEVESEHLHKKLHSKIAISLEYDTVIFTNEKAGLDAAPIMFEKENYKISWNEPLFETGKANFEIINTLFNESNTNCR